MDIFGINTIQETVHLVSMFSYMNTLSEFLFSGSFITEQEKSDLIPVTNGIYRYLESFADTPEGIQKRKGTLIKEIIKGSDIYGGKPDENPDPLFVNELFKRIITSIVFNNDVNIFGFIVDTIRNSDTLDVGKIIDQMRDRMNDPLPSVAGERAFNDYVLPMFPLPDDDSVNLTSVEFLYAQAGAMFVLSGSAHAEFYQIFPINETGSKFQEYSFLAHGIEYLINSGQIPDSVVKIFLLPALLYYVTSNRKNLAYETTANIVTNPDHLEKALELLFHHLNDTISQAIAALQSDSRIQFLAAASRYQNRTEMARNLIVDLCLLPNWVNLDDEIISYENNPEEFTCYIKNRNIENQSPGKEIMPNLNERFHQQNEIISEKYFQYEKEAILELFGEEFIKSVDNDEVEISKASYNGAMDSSAFMIKNFLKQNNDNDLLKFRYVRTGQDVNYALIRTNNNSLQLLREADDIHFWEKLGLPTRLMGSSLRSIKNIRELFAVAVNTTANDHKELMNNDLNNQVYDFDKIQFVSQDSLMHTTSSQLAKMEIKFSTLIFLDSFPQLAERSVPDISSIFRFKIRKIKPAVRRINPGCELIFSLGKTSFLALRSLVTQFEMENSLKFPIINNFLKKFTELASSRYAKKSTMFGKNVYYRTTGDKGFGYGYKFVEQPVNSHPYAQLRSVVELDEEIPVVFTRIENGEKIYSEVNLYTGNIDGEYHLQNRFPFENSENAETQICVNGEYNTGSCLRERKKSSTLSLCPRSKLRYEQKNRNKQAINIARSRNFHLPNNIIDSELNSYIFTKKGNERDFINDWIKFNEIPSFWNKMKLKSPNEFQSLMFNETLDNPTLTEWDANLQIFENFAFEDSNDIILFKPVNIVRDEFLQCRGYESMRFIDYYSLVHFMYREGFRGENFDVVEKILITRAIYRLAIRQSIGSKLPKKLFTITTASLDDFVENIKNNEGKEISFAGFIMTRKSLNSAKQITHLLNTGEIRVVYQFTMPERYLSARVNNVLMGDIEEYILLPGMTFYVDKIDLNGNQLEAQVELSFSRRSHIKLDMVEVMNKIHDLDSHLDSLYVEVMN